MPTTSRSRIARTAAGLLAAGLVLAPLTACSSKNVSCSTNSCTATLSGDEASAKIFGTTVKFGGVKDGRATLGVGDASVSCAEGESIGAGPLSVTCTDVTDDAVELTAKLS
jgi:hypothetical protein